MREIDKINNVVVDIDKYSILEIDENLYKTFKLIRENYNKVLSNIQK